MSRHNQETPMDFEFQNGTGPLDSRSPFAQISQNPQRLGPLSSPSKKSTNDRPYATNNLNRTRPDTYGAFGSPSKPTTAPSHPSSPSKPLPVPPTAAFNSLFTTPRKANFQDFDDSSAGETPRSPEGRDDSDATPDMVKLRNTLNKWEGNTRPTSSGTETRHSPTKERPSHPRRDSLIVRIKNKLYSPGRGEVPRADYSNAMERKIEKRRKREVDRRVARKRRHSMTDSEADNDNHSGSPRKGGQSTALNERDGNKPPWIVSFFTFIAQHPTVPHILSFYAQLIFNLFLLCGCGYLFYCFWSAVQGDVDKKSHEAMADIMAEMAACAEHYTANKCDRSTRVPAMETVCENWAKCMNRDPARVGRAKVSAHTFAEIFNSFVEPISYKAMAFTFILVFGCFGISNFAFGFFRDKAQPASGYQPYYNPQAPPPTPQRSFSGPEGGFYAGGTPWHQPQIGLEPLPSGTYGQIEGRGSPVRRLAYE